VTTAHLLHVVIIQWHHGMWRHWRHWHLAFKYVRRLTGPHASRGYIRAFLRFLVHRHISPNHWAGWNQA
jgi:hypothetical protein